MRRIFSIYIILTICTHSLFAEKNKKYTLADSTYVISLLQQAERNADVDYKKSYDLALEAQKISTLIHFENGKEKCHLYFGNYAYYTGNYQEAISHYVKALTYCDKVGNKIGVADITNNIGNVYYSQNNFDKALEQFNKSLSFYELISNEHGISRVLTNIGNVYFSKEEYDKALSYYKQSLAIKKKIKDLNGEGLLLNNIGNIYGSTGQYGLSLVYFQKALAIKKQTNDKYGESLALVNIGYLYTLMKDYALAIQNTEEGIKIARSIKSLDICKDAYSSLANIHYESGSFRLAYEFFMKYDNIKDSLINEETQKNIKEIEAKYDSEKKDAAHKAQLEKLKLQREKDEADQQRKDIFIYGLIGVISLVIVLLLVLIRSNRNKQRTNLLLNKQKNLIQEKNEQLSEKNKNITDSINYAKRLQQAILPKEEEIKNHLPDSFILYMPKDIVAGDFYFFETTATHIFYAAADCTGHGVPGAMVSVVCSNALTRCVKEFGMVEPGKILDKTRELVLETFAKSGSDVKDGMDISLLVIELPEGLRLQNTKSQTAGPQLSNLKLTWAGANNPLWYIENGELKEIAANKQPIGKTDNPKPFTSHTLPLSTSSLFLFTDGYADQFGGPNKKKFNYKRMKEILTSCSSDMKNAQLKLEQTIIDWKGDTEQLDDICIIGIQF